MVQKTAIRVSEVDSREMPTIHAHMSKQAPAIAAALPEGKRAGFESFMAIGAALDRKVADYVVRAGKLNYVVDWSINGYAQVLAGVAQGFRGEDVVALTEEEAELVKLAQLLRAHFIGPDLKFLNFDNFDQFRACRQRLLRLDSKPEGRPETGHELAAKLGHTPFVGRIQRTVDAFGRALGVGDELNGIDRQLDLWQAALRRLLTTIEDMRDDSGKVVDVLQDHVVTPYLEALERQRKRRSKKGGGAPEEDVTTDPTDVVVV